MFELAKDKEILKKLFKLCKEYPDKERYHALYIRSIGYSRKSVAELFCRDEDTIQEWENKWLKEKDVNNKPKDGRPNEIDKKTEDMIIKFVDENNPKKHGMSCSFWDCVELHKFFLMKGIDMNRETIRRILKKNGFRYVKTDYEYAQADEKERAQFLQELSQILENREKGSAVLFADEMGTLLHPKKGYMWTRDKKAIVKTYSSRKKVSVLGAVNPLTGSKEIIQTSDRIDVNKFIGFLDKIYTRFKGIIYLFLDNLKMHKRIEVADWIKLHSRMKMIFISRYSPDLNIQEWFWNFSRKKFLNNKVFKTTKQMMSSFSWFVRKLDKSIVRKICNIDILLNRIT